MLTKRTVAPLAVILILACGSTKETPQDAGVGGAHDAAAVEGGPGVDAGPPEYNGLTQTSSWSTFGAATVNPSANGFCGATFDGRYVYLVPDADGSSTDGLVVRFDTRASFGAGASWSTFDATTVSPASRGFQGAAFDGRYVYLVPHAGTSTAYGGTVTRYDTQASFTATASWSTFDTTVLSASAAGFSGATFDGRYVYLAPAVAATGIVATPVTRYDTHASMTAPSSWSTFNVTTVSPGANGFVGAVFDGRYVYLVPSENNVSGPDVSPDGVVTRYDTQASFTAAGSWSTFDTTTVRSGAEGFAGGAFDGRYVYLVPLVRSGSATGSIVTRYDTQASFTAGGSWSTFDTTTLSAAPSGFFGAAFDGRYVYLVPNHGGGVGGGIVTRYDTQASFGASTSWSTFDVTTLSAPATPSPGFYGAAFDGRYVYLVPGLAGGVVARFDAKSPPSLPALPAFYGSFF